MSRWSSSLRTPSCLAWRVRVRRLRIAAPPTARVTRADHALAYVRCAATLKPSETKIVTSRKGGYKTGAPQLCTYASGEKKNKKQEGYLRV